ncbi:deoxyribonuclease IV [Litchfieldia alkalitelluris]|uniref:deoxyribonuclease IV n=1 Tax=Litchfieldia alkalitelluris TaxID=304268 RepID=UPI0009960965|nr:deoxyribonuclease IV [Litchfieldia alkalitelluris]
MNLGAHISIRQGYLLAAKTAKDIGGSSFQYFPKNPRSLSVKEFSEQDAFACASYCKENNMSSIAHTPYPTNLSSKGSERDKVVASLVNDLEIAEACQSIGVVVHFGVSKNSKDPLEGYLLMIETLNIVCDLWHGKCLLLIENNAGKSGPAGTTFEELVQVRNLVDFPEKIGFCFDTCHGFASGLWTGNNWLEIEEKGTQIGYFEHLKAIHLNNSMYPSGSMKDRHANIHNGHIEKAQMKEFLGSKLLRNLPLILETPTSNNFTHQNEIELIKNNYL